jgi:protein ImuB
MMRTLVVWCPDWPVTATGHGAAGPVAVVRANRVVACSAAARADGVERGQRRRLAQSRSPGLIVVEHDPARDARAFEPVVVAVEAFCPEVEIVRPGVCAFATRGPSRYFGGDHALAERVAAAVGRSCRVGVADGLFAAQQAARHDPARPADVNVISPGGSATFLAPLPVHVLESPDLSDILRRLGILTLGDLAALPVAAVVGRFGLEGLWAHRLAAARDARPPVAREAAPDLQVSTELDPPAERVDVAAFAAKVLADELHATLVARGLACSRVRIEAETEHGEHLARVWRHDGTLTAAMLAERVRWQLDGWLASPGAVTAGITLLRLRPDEVRADDGRQLGFWGADRAVADRAGRALVRLQGMLGPEAVLTAVVGGGRSPVDRVRLVPWGDATTALDEAPWPGRLRAPTPSIVHHAPPPAEVIDAAGATVRVSGRGASSAAPASLSIDGGPWVDITAWAGPWPVDERWWTGTPRRRARWQVVTADGRAHLLAVEGGRWLVEASYD